MFLFGARKIIWPAPFPDAEGLLSWCALKANICIFLYSSLKKFLFQRCSKISSGGMVGWCRLNNFLEVALSLVKCFTIFHLIEVLRNSTIFSLSLNNMTIKQQIKYVAIQKVCHLHNGSFRPVQLCHTLSILLYRFLVPFSKLHQETIEWEGKRFFAYMTAFLDTFAFIRNPHWQGSGVLIVLCKNYIVIPDTLVFLGYALFLLAVILSELHEKPRRKDWVTEKSA